MVEVFSVQDGLDAERALLDEVCGGAREHGLLLWQPCDRALVMPRRMERLEGFAPASAAVAERGWPVLLRDTGGEPVPQSPGVLNIALSYALGPGDNEQTRIETAYLRLCQPICDWLRERGLDAGVGAVAGSFCDGRYNVTLDGRKLAGTAQRWRRNGAGRWCWRTRRCWSAPSARRWSRWSTPSPAVAAVPRIARRTAISA